MQRYFFHIVEDGRAKHHDLEGEAFDTLAAAKLEACHGAVTIAQERFQEARRGSTEVVIRGELGTVVGQVKLSFQCD